MQITKAQLEKLGTLELEHIATDIQEILAERAMAEDTSSLPLRRPHRDTNERRFEIVTVKPEPPEPKTNKLVYKDD